ncbi:telomeric repeat-binding factor 2-interacting protein 1-like [Euwallacea similis]|uniref:telomeric repeat-binding factor 2-interacting protein 1-like n=1 Tax=Euwallacea similis TaxID=1736056 RepID=UPI00344ED66F
MNKTASSWAYSIKEDKEILRYILDGQYQEIYKGDRVWKQMEKDQVCKPRSWQSMKNRFLKYILRHIKQPLYELTVEEINSVKLMLPLEILKKKSITTYQSLDSASSRQGADVNQNNSFMSHDNDEVPQNVPDRPTSTVHHRRHIYHDIHEPDIVFGLTKGEELKTVQPSGKVLKSSTPNIWKEKSLKKLGKAEKKRKESDQTCHVGVHVNTEKNYESNSHASELVQADIFKDVVNDAAVQVKTEHEESNVDDDVRPVRSGSNDNLNDQIQVYLEPDQGIPDSINTDSLPGINTVRVGNSSTYWLSRDRTQEIASKRKGARSRQKKVDTIPKDFYSLDLNCSDSDIA